MTAERPRCHQGTRPRGGVDDHTRFTIVLLLCDESDARICERTVDVRWPQVVEQVHGRTQTPSRDRTLQGTAEHILDVLVPDMVEQLPNTVSQDRIRQRTVEQIVDTSDPQVVETLVVVSRVFPQDRSQQRFAEQAGAIPGISLAEKIVEGLGTQKQGNTQQVVNTDAQHVVNTVEAEVPLSQFTDKVVEIPVVAQRQISTVQTVQNSIEISQLQYCDEVIDVPVVLVVQAPQSQVVAETAGIPQLQITDQVTDVPVVLVVPVPQVRVVKKTVEDPQFQIVEKTVENPETQTIQGWDVKVSQVQVAVETVQIPQVPLIDNIEYQLSADADSSEVQLLIESGESKDDISIPTCVDEEKIEATVHDVPVLPEERQRSKRQRHSSQHQSAKQQPAKQAAKEREEGERVKGEEERTDGRKSEEKVVREGEKKKGGQVEKEQGREEREKGRKGQRERGQEGRKKEEREAEEGGGELVEKDVTGWTEVTRNKRKKMVQIFVKVDGMKTVAMEVSPEDKVQKILNTVSGTDRDEYVTSGGRILRGSDKLKSCEVRDGSTVEVTGRMRGGGKHKDRKGKGENKQVAQLDDGMCAMACEQMRQVMETLRTYSRSQEASER